MNAQLTISRIEPRVSPDPASEPDYLLTEMDGNRVIKSMRYGDADVASHGLERVREWVAEDLQRYRDWEGDRWRYLDVRLVAVVEVSADGRQVGTLEVDGPVLGGVESDAGHEYMSQIVAELAEEFRHELADMGFADVTHVEPSPLAWES